MKLLFFKNSPFKTENEDTNGNDYTGKKVQDKSCLRIVNHTDIPQPVLIPIYLKD